MKVSYLAVTSFHLRAVLGSPGGLRGAQDEIDAHGGSTGGGKCCYNGDSSCINMHGCNPSDHYCSQNSSNCEVHCGGNYCDSWSLNPSLANLTPVSSTPAPPIPTLSITLATPNPTPSIAAPDAPPQSSSASSSQETPQAQPPLPTPAPATTSNSASTPQNTQPAQTPLPNGESTGGGKCCYNGDASCLNMHGCNPSDHYCSQSSTNCVVHCGGNYCNSSSSLNPSPATSQNIMTLYHTTSPNIAELILNSSFRPGHSGWCGGAIYFYTSPHLPQSKLGPDSHTGAVIEARVNMGRMAHLDNTCGGADEAKLHYDSITFNPGDGAEYLVWSSDRVISMKRYS